MNNASNETKAVKPNAAANLMQLMSFTADKALEMADANSVLGEQIQLEGMTIIPVSKISCGFAGGGASMVNAELKKSNTPSGSGAKVTVTPLTFLVIKDGEARVIDIKANEKSTPANIIGSVVEKIKSMKKK